MGRSLAAILGLQWALGISNVVFALPLAVAVLHNAGGAALLLAVIAVNFAAFGRTQERVAHQARGFAADQGSATSS